MSANLSQTSEFRKQALPAVLFLALLGLIFVDRPNWTAPPPPRVWTKLEMPRDRSFVAAIESPLKAQQRDSLLLYGWAAAAAPQARVAKIEIRIDGKLAGETGDFVPRPEIAASFGRSDLEASAWQCVVPVGNLPTGNHQLQLDVVGSDGRRESALTKSLSVVE